MKTQTKEILRDISFILPGIAIMGFYKWLASYAGYAMGGIILLYALQRLVFSAIDKTLLKDNDVLFENIAQIVVGLLLIFANGDVVKVCVIWGVWTIARESRELAGALKKILSIRIGFINALESVVVSVFAVLLIVEQSAHHATFHMALLGFELILEIAFEALEEFVYKSRKEKEERAIVKAKLTEEFENVDEQKTA